MLLDGLLIVELDEDGIEIGACTESKNELHLRLAAADDVDDDGWIE